MGLNFLIERSKCPMALQNTVHTFSKVNNAQTANASIYTNYSKKEKLFQETPRLLSSNKIQGLFK